MNFFLGALRVKLVNENEMGAVQMDFTALLARWLSSLGIIWAESGVHPFYTLTQTQMIVYEQTTYQMLIGSAVA